MAKGQNYLKGILPARAFKGKDEQGNAAFYEWEYKGTVIELGVYRDGPTASDPIYSYVVSALRRGRSIPGFGEKQFKVPETQQGVNVYPTRRRAIKYLKKVGMLVKSHSKLGAQEFSQAWLDER
jgi:hypothetical protein